MRSLIQKTMKWVIPLAILAGVVYYQFLRPVHVDSDQVSAGDVVAEVFGTGTLEARVRASIGPKISGKISQVLVDQGDMVKTGDLLIQLEDKDFVEQVEIARANVDAAKAAVERLLADKNRAIATNELSQKTFDRQAALIQRKAVSQEDVDTSKAALNVARADVARAEAAIAEGQKNLVAAEKNLQFYEMKLRDTRIPALFDGLIVKRNHEPGDIIVPGSNALSLISLKEMWVSAWVDETQMSKLQPGQSARIAFRSEPWRQYPAKVARVGKEVDRETREFVVDVNAISLPQNWAVGQRADVRIEIDRKENVIVISSRFLIRQEGNTGVFVFENGTARWREIKIGLEGRETVEILSGLSLKERVVIPRPNQPALRDGRRVSVR